MEDDQHIARNDHCGKDHRATHRSNAKSDSKGHWHYAGITNQSPTESSADNCG